MHEILQADAKNYLPRHFSARHVAHLPYYRQRVLQWDERGYRGD